MNKSTIWLLFAILISVIFVIWFNYTKIIFDISLLDIVNRADLPEDAGRFGDVYGSLNTLFSGVAFAALFISILFQSAELSATREEMKNQGDQFKKQTEMLDKQSFENSLFQLMSFNNELIQSLTIQKTRTEFGDKYGTVREVVDTITGRQVLFDLSVELGDMARAKKTPCRYKNRTVSPSDVYSTFYKNHEDKLGSYFRGLYQTLKLIDDSGYAAMIKKQYVDLVIAQTSKYEMYLLFYHGLSEQAQNKLKFLLEKYEFLEFYPNEIGFLWQDMLEYNFSVFGWEDKKKFKEYLYSFCRVEKDWLNGRKIIAYIDGDTEPYDITEDITNLTAEGTSNYNYIRGIRENKIIWIEFVAPESVENTSLEGVTNQDHQEGSVFELPTKRYLVG